MTTKVKKKTEAATLGERVPIFEVWHDIAPALLHIAENEAEARIWIQGWNSWSDTLKGDAATLSEILADPEGLGLGCDPARP